MEDKKKILQTEKRNRFFVLFKSLLVIIKDEKNNSSFLRSQVGVVICQDDLTERLRWNYSREILRIQIKIVPLLVIILVLRLILYFIDRFFVSLSLDRSSIGRKSEWRHLKISEGSAWARVNHLDRMRAVCCKAKVATSYQ